MQPAGGGSCRKLVLPGDRPDGIRAGRPIGGESAFCNSSGCYRRYDDFRADFESTRGAWGFGPIEGTYSLYNAGAVEAGVRRAWSPNGFTARDQENFDHVQVIQFSWKLPGYPGYWYTWVKSPNATSSDKAIYRFRNLDQLPAEPFGGGHKL